MKRRINASQGDLFGITEIESIREEIQHLDQAIAKAMKTGKYAEAKQFTVKQENLIQKLVEMGEMNKT